MNVSVGRYKLGVNGIGVPGFVGIDELLKGGGGVAKLLLCERMHRKVGTS